MHAATPVEAANGLSVPPPLHFLRPLLCEMVLPERLERTHDLAVHQSGPERIELTGDRSHRGFVEQREAPRDVALEDQTSCFRDPANGRGSGLAIRARFDGSLSPLSGAGEVA